MFFVGFYLFATLKPVFPYIEYAVNYEHISTELCVNKNNPEMECQGKCHLQKQIVENENPEKGPALPNFKKDVKDYYLPSENSIKLENTSQFGNELLLCTNLQISNGFLADVFDPPDSLF